MVRGVRRSFGRPPPPERAVTSGAPSAAQRCLAGSMALPTQSTNTPTVRPLLLRDLGPAAAEVAVAAAAAAAAQR